MPPIMRIIKLNVRLFELLQGFGQAIVLENSAIASAEYVANGGQWQFQLPEAYDSQLVPASDFKECVNCSTSQSAYWRRADGGHSLCHQCSYSRQSRPPKSQKAKPQTVSGKTLESHATMP